MKTTETKEKPVDIRSEVRKHYGKAAKAYQPAREGCGCSGGAEVSLVKKMYDAPEVNDVPDDVANFSMGCGDPVTLASLKPGQTVLDLGAGGGLDCFLAARQVGETGHVIGVDMTAEMLEKARANQARMGVKNVDFRLGEIEHLPVADASVDVIISNCVINLAPDKAQVFGEAFRVLRPGGRLAVSDIVTDKPLPEKVRKDLKAWAGCVAGALDIGAYQQMLEAAGFVDVQITTEPPDEAMVAELKKQIPADLAKKPGRRMVISDGAGVTVIELGDDGSGGGMAGQAASSARITARKP